MPRKFRTAPLFPGTPHSLTGDGFSPSLVKHGHVEWLDLLLSKWVLLSLESDSIIFLLLQYSLQYFSVSSLPPMSMSSLWLRQWGIIVILKLILIPLIVIIILRTITIIITLFKSQYKESNPGHIGGRRVLSPLHQLCLSPKILDQGFVKDSLWGFRSKHQSSGSVVSPRCAECYYLSSRGV